ncbi:MULTISPECIES: alpha/beta hydrolase [unclassified Cellulophaga]|uniref:alpha/beta hydrolase n=1 Tax=unclassified Cellulophaga TaxID=2634405 RepID=UPI0026E30EED|nr:MULTISPECIES: alpha/beta hydrolase [unclassified Cellulophaga]MDO6491441.1 alpha/beta hydrolase [Cellulophaga sp. 2_MG-2023]MDO6493318.1 alpha/beta hydrolase [Cellulophaga sp. 3_MG-2023]
MKKLLFTATVFLFFCVNTYSQNIILPLWNDQIPNQKVTKEVEKAVTDKIIKVSNVQKPTIEVYLPKKEIANGKAVVIFPGGGYGFIAYDWEGINIAKFLNAKGIAGIVVKYRLPNSKSLKVGSNAPLQDAQRAIRLVRSNAKKWNINSDELGILGFSAGGHLASTLGTHFNDEIYKAKDKIDSISAKPSFMALAYPVITFVKEEYVHKGSRNNLLQNLVASEASKKQFSAELNITKETPKTFLVHATDDTAVPVENSLLMYSALKNKGVPVQMHIYESGGHGFALGLKNKKLSNWTNLLVNWINNLD